jgi:hypothetical protein
MRDACKVQVVHFFETAAIGKGKACPTLLNAAVFIEVTT